MTRDEAKHIVGLLNAAFVNTTMELESTILYISEIALLQDGDTGLETAQLIVRQGVAFPTIKEFRATYRTVSERRRSDIPALVEGPTVPMPEWVQVWWWCRRKLTHPDLRGFPQQHGEFQGECMNLQEYRALRDRWLEAGSPGPRSVAEAVGA